MADIKYLSKTEFDYIDELLDRGYIGQWFVRAMRYNPKKLISSYNDPNYENIKKDIENIKGSSIIYPSDYVFTTTQYTSLVKEPSLSTLSRDTAKVPVKESASKMQYKAMRRIND